jgi:hypothetical protein
MAAMRERYITCTDGFSMSVQASKFHYCSPRMDHAEAYTSVEVGFLCLPVSRTIHVRRQSGGWLCAARRCAGRH